jgi:hypothetical protein
MHQQIRLACAAAMLLAVLLATPAAAGRQLKGANLIKGGKGPRYAVYAPAIGAFTQQRTYFVPTAAAPVVAAAYAPTVAASYAPVYQPVVASQPVVVAAQPTMVAAAPATYVAAAPQYVAAQAQPKTDIGIKMNIGVELAKSVQGNIKQHFGW